MKIDQKQHELNESFHSNNPIMVMGCGKHGGATLGIQIETGKLIINRTIFYFLQTPMKTRLKAQRVNPMKFFILIIL